MLVDCPKCVGSTQFICKANIGFCKIETLIYMLKQQQREI